MKRSTKHKTRRLIALLLILFMCLGMMSPALAADFDDLQDALNSSNDISEPEPSETDGEIGGETGGENGAETGGETGGETSGEPETHDNGTKISEDNGGTYGYGWNEENQENDSLGWDIWAWNDEIGNRNVKLFEDVKHDEDQDGQDVGTITVENGSVNLDLNGNDIDATGSDSAAITVNQGGSLTLSNSTEGSTGNVIGADGQNTATVNKGGDLTMEDGVNITHNAGNQYDSETHEYTKAEGNTTTGRGVEVNGGSFTMNGGSVSNNAVGGEVGETSDLNDNKENGCFEGKIGGGVWVHDGGTFTMNGGEVSNNAAAEGGGVYVGETNTNGDDSSSFQMTGGKVDGNVAKSGEGGGIYIRSTTKENGAIKNVITGGDITNNATLGEKDLGGGGIYIENNCELQIKNAVITGNTANGNGGGIGACVHGQTVIALADGAIIYANIANGNTKTRGYNGGSWAADGSKLWEDDKDLNGDDTVAQDIFTAGSGADGYAGIVVCSEMLNGIKPGWSGVGYQLTDNKDGADGWYIPGYYGPGSYGTGQAPANGKYYKVVEVKADENGKVAVSANRILGLTASESDEAASAIQAFLNGVRQDQRVLIKGNYSAVHGGGIGNNGKLNIGTYSDNTINGLDTVITIDTTKTVQSVDPETVGEDERVIAGDQFTMQGGEFIFELVGNPESTEVLYTATNSKDGKVDIRIPTALLQSAKDGQTLTFYLREKNDGAAQIGYDEAVYKIEVKVTVSGNVVSDFKVGGDHITVKQLTATTTVSKQDANNNWVILEEGVAANFTNTYTKKTEECTHITVRKEWANDTGVARPSSVKVQLYKDDEPYGEPMTLSEENNWTGDWMKLDLTDKDGKKIEWTVQELELPNGYSVGYSPDGKLVVVTNTYVPKEPPKDPPKDPESPNKPESPNEPEYSEEPTVIPNEDVPLAEISDEETLPAEIPDEEVPLVEVPDEEIPLVEIPEEPVPLANAPQTSDSNNAIPFVVLMMVAVVGLAVARKRLN